MIFVAKDVEHRFVDIEEDLSMLVFFAPEHQPLIDREHQHRRRRFGTRVA